MGTIHAGVAERERKLSSEYDWVNFASDSLRLIGSMLSSDALSAEMKKVMERSEPASNVGPTVPPRPLGESELLPDYFAKPEGSCTKIYFGD